MPKNRDILLSVMVSLDVTFSNPGERAIRHKTLKRVLNKTRDCQASPGAGFGELGLGQGQQQLPRHFGHPGTVLVIYKCMHTKYAHI